MILVYNKYVYKAYKVSTGKMKELYIIQRECCKYCVGEIGWSVRTRIKEHPPSQNIP